MSRVFLSHSSEDKEWYVNIVYNKLVKALGEDNRNSRKLIPTTFALIYFNQS